MYVCLTVDLCLYSIHELVVSAYPALRLFVHGTRLIVELLWVGRSAGLSVTSCP